MKREPVIWIVLAMVASLLLVYGRNAVRNGPTLEALAAARMQGAVAPEFALPTTDGKLIRLSDFRGHAVVLSFWATTCGPCKIEMPWFVELQRQYGPQGLQILGADVKDDAPIADVTSFAQDLGVNYPILVGKRAEQDAIGNNYGGLPFLPTTVFITRDGKVSEMTIGLTSKSGVEASIRKVLAQPAVAEAPGKQAGSVERLQGTGVISGTSPQ